MINFEDAVIKQMIVHRVESESLILNSLPFYHSGEAEENALKRILLKTFATQAITYEFGHDVDLEYNVAYRTAKQLFHTGEFIECSHDLTTHLQSVSKHPNINDGSLQSRHIWRWINPRDITFIIPKISTPPFHFNNL